MLLLSLWDHSSPSAELIEGLRLLKLVRQQVENEPTLLQTKLSPVGVTWIRPRGIKQAADEKEQHTSVTHAGADKCNNKWHVDRRCVCFLYSKHLRNKCTVIRQERVKFVSFCAGRSCTSLDTLCYMNTSFIAVNSSTTVINYDTMPEMSTCSVCPARWPWRCAAVIHSLFRSWPLCESVTGCGFSVDMSYEKLREAWPESEFTCARCLI